MPCYVFSNTGRLFNVLNAEVAIIVAHVCLLKRSFFLCRIYSLNNFISLKGRICLI